MEDDVKEPFVVSNHDVSLDSSYSEWIVGIQDLFRKTQIKAALKVNSEMIHFYWVLGRDISTKFDEDHYGKGIIEHISLDLQALFPQSKGFSARNLWNVRKWYNCFSKPEIIEKLHQLGAELQCADNQIKVKMHQVGAEITDSDYPWILGFVPWRHYSEIISKCKQGADEILFYIRKTITEDLSRNALINLIEANLYGKSQGLPNNFSEILPKKQSKVAKDMFKDVYDLNFVTVDAENYSEGDLELQLERNITRFLLELGTGFTFAGRQREIIVSGKTRKIDMLFYHTKLHCYVVCELKVKPFEPEFASKLNFYVNAVDDLIKGESDNPTIGLLICKSKNDMEVKWAFKGIVTPLGVASYKNVQIKDVQKYLPTPEQIQEQIMITEKLFDSNNSSDTGE